MLDLLRRRRFDLLMVLGYGLAAGIVLGRLWKGVNTRVQSGNIQDQIFFEWVLARAARAVTHLENPFFTTQLNYPDGVNLMANTSVLAAGIPLTPVTLLFGPQVSYAVMLTAALAGTAFAWYFVLSRHIVSSRAAAAVGGLVCGFSPAIISQANGHPNLASQFVIPFIVWQALRLARPEGRVLRDGTVLGLLIVAQAFINEEILLFTAIALGLFVGVYAVQRREVVRERIKPLFAGLGVAAGVALVLLAYPLYVQFFGPQHYKGMDHWFELKLDVLSYPAFGRLSLGTHPAMSPVSVHEAEENAFYGWPLFVLLVAAAVWLWRDVAARSLTIVGAAFVLMSFGPVIAVGNADTGIPGPWAVLGELPVLNFVNPIRLGLVTVPVVGVLMALACDRLAKLADQAGDQRRLVRLSGAVLLAAALMPIVPIPLPAQPRNAPPAFIADGDYRPFIENGRTLVPVPLPTWPEPVGMWWSASRGVDFSMPWGYYVGPKSGEAGDVGTLSPPSRPTPTLLQAVEKDKKAARVSDVDRRQARADLKHWNAGVVVLDTRHPAADALRTTLQDLLEAAPESRGGVWFWDVRGL